MFCAFNMMFVCEAGKITFDFSELLKLNEKKTRFGCNSTYTTFGIPEFLKAPEMTQLSNN